MRCPTLKELPSPSTGDKRWPWTEESPQFPDTMPDSLPWPRISIVTPSLNQGQFLEETIRSVLLQGYPDLQYIIIDGGSTDESITIIKKYEKWLGYWVSEPDRGQSHAINKGFSAATGKIVSWLNSDDLYLPNTFKTITDYSSKYPEAGAWAGGGRQIDSKTGEKIWDRPPPPLGFEEILCWSQYSLPQPSCFLNRSVLNNTLFVNEKYHMRMDFDLWLRAILDEKRFYNVQEPLIKYRVNPFGMTGKHKKEMIQAHMIVWRQFMVKFRSIAARNRMYN